MHKNKYYKTMRKTPDDYGDETGLVYFEIPNASKNLALKILISMDQVEKESITEINHGFKLIICNQLIPEIVRAFSNENIAIYQVIRLDD